MQHIEVEDEYEESASKRRRINDAKEDRIQDYEQAHQEGLRAGDKSYSSARVSGHASLWQGDHYGPQINHYHCSDKPQPSHEGKCQILLDSLEFDRMDARLRNVANALPNTCLWLQRHDYFLLWDDATQMNEHGGFLWIKGKPGSGKSTIMKATTEWAKEVWSTRVILTYFFNARSPDQLEKSSIGLYRSLVHQFLTICPDQQELFVEEFASKVQKNKMVEEWSETELQNFLSKSITARPYREVVIFIDALDEGQDDDVRALVNYLERLLLQSTFSGAEVRICLASRHFPHITIRKGLSIVLEKQVAHERDIDSYIFQQMFVSEHPQMDELRNQVRSRSRGVFLWVVLAVSLLNKLFDRGQSLSRMFRHLDDIPPELHDIFASILSRDRSDIDQCITLLRWVLFALEPLYPAQLYTAVQSSLPDDTWGGDVPTDDIIKRYLLNCSRGLVESTTEGPPVIQIIHETIRDFLLGKSTIDHSSTNTSTDPIVSLEFQADNCHLMIAEECLQFLIHLDHSPSSTNANESSLARYAARYWWQHIQASNTECGPRLLSLTCAFFNDTTHLLNWLRHFNIDFEVGPYNAAGLTIDDLAPSLYYAVSVGLTKTTNFLLEQGADVNAHGGEYGTALQAASVKGHVQIVGLLLDKGAEVNAQGGFFCTALQAASGGGNTQIVQMLLDKGAKVNILGGHYDTALMAAITIGRVPIVQRLLEHGAEVNLRYDHYGTALEAALRWKIGPDWRDERAQMEQMLREHGALG